MRPFQITTRFHFHLNVLFLRTSSIMYTDNSGFVAGYQSPFSQRSKHATPCIFGLHLQAWVAEFLKHTHPLYRFVTKMAQQSDVFCPRLVMSRIYIYNFLCIFFYIQWGKKVFSQPPIVQVLQLKKMREPCNFHHRYTSTMTTK